MRHEPVFKPVQASTMDGIVELLCPPTKEVHPLELLAREIERRGSPFNMTHADECGMAAAKRIGLLPARRKPHFLHGQDCACPECVDYHRADFGGLSPGEAMEIFACDAPGIPRNASKRDAAAFFRRRVAELTETKRALELA